MVTDVACYPTAIVRKYTYEYLDNNTLFLYATVRKTQIFTNPIPKKTSSKVQLVLLLRYFLFLVKTRSKNLTTFTNVIFKTRQSSWIHYGWLISRTSGNHYGRTEYSQTSRQFFQNPRPIKHWKHHRLINSHRDQIVEKTTQSFTINFNVTGGEVNQFIETLK